MKKLKIEDLEKIKQRVQKDTYLREGAGKAKITVHMGTCGIAAGARKIMSTILDELQKRDIHDIIVTNSGCAGLCSREPMMTVERKGETPVKYVDLTPEKTLKILEDHVIGGMSLQNMPLEKEAKGQPDNKISILFLYRVLLDKKMIRAIIKEIK